MKRKHAGILIVLLTLIMCLVTLCACNGGDSFRNECNGEPVSGEFYTLQQAFDNGWISRGDLRNIAYYYAGDAQKKGFEPTPKTPETLSDETKTAIKESYMASYPNSMINFDDVFSKRYYGVYEGLVALLIENSGFCAIKEETIGGVKFIYAYYNISIVLWKGEIEANNE